MDRDEHKNNAMMIITAIQDDDEEEDSSPPIPPLPPRPNPIDFGESPPSSPEMRSRTLETTAGVPAPESFSSTFAALPGIHRAFDCLFPVVPCNFILYFLLSNPCRH